MLSFQSPNLPIVEGGVCEGHFQQDVSVTTGSFSSEDKLDEAPLSSATSQRDSSDFF